jgi:sterol desaturase/sphingolipid hydroxylase (fatty acid hydroxylase superfamily)
MLPTLNEVVQASSVWFVTIFSIFVFFLMEKRWPKFANVNHVAGRGRAIIVLAGLTLALGLFFQKHVQSGLISALVPLQITSIAKWSVADWLVIAVSFLVLDFLHYAMHRIAHRLPVLWRLHSIHHSDKHVTALTGLLHHPLEFLPTALFVLFFAVVLGLPVLLYIIYGFAAALHNAFSHSEIALPLWLDRLLRVVIITPDMHRTHHSVDMAEGNSNFGAILSVWDWLFGTYTHHPATGEANLAMGLSPADGPESFTVKHMLLHPFKLRQKAKK